MDDKKRDYDQKSAENSFLLTITNQNRPQKVKYCYFNYRIVINFI
jgi:hypothetical protein